jgi:hypothetical protein
VGRSYLLDLLIRRGEISQRHRNGDGLLGEILERDLQLPARFHRRQRIGRDRGVGVAAARFAGLDLQVSYLAVIDLQFGANRQIEPERQLNDGEGRAGVAGHADVDQHDQLSGLGEGGGSEIRCSRMCRYPRKVKLLGGLLDRFVAIPLVVVAAC